MPSDVHPDKCDRCHEYDADLEYIYGVGWYCSTCRFIHKKQKHKRELDEAFASLERAMLAVPPEVFELRRRQFETMKKNREQDEAMRPKTKAKRRETWKRN
jgi:hypothetical protein